MKSHAAPREIANITGDEVANCWPVSAELSHKLENMAYSATSPSPLGGDGSHGTTETPEPHEGNDTLAYLWAVLTESERAEIVDAWRTLP